ncbi:MAG: PfkB family carbohydrate kinase, partial [Gaiellaceae bacterium]
KLRATTPTLDPVSTIGAGDALLAGYLAARYQDRNAEDSIRQAVATGAASVLEAGAGRFDQKEVARLSSGVSVDVLAGASAAS